MYACVCVCVYVCVGMCVCASPTLKCWCLRDAVLWVVGEVGGVKVQRCSQVCAGGCWIAGYGEGGRE